MPRSPCQREKICREATRDGGFLNEKEGLSTPAVRFSPSQCSVRAPAKDVSLCGASAFLPSLLPRKSQNGILANSVAPRLTLYLAIRLRLARALKLTYPRTRLRHRAGVKVNRTWRLATKADSPTVHK